MCFLFTDMRRDVQEIFRNTPHGKQVMMFSATLSKEIRPVCKKFMQDVNSTHSSTITTTPVSCTAGTSTSAIASNVRLLESDCVGGNSLPYCRWDRGFFKRHQNPIIHNQTVKMGPCREIGAVSWA